MVQVSVKSLNKGPSGAADDKSKPKKAPAKKPAALAAAPSKNEQRASLDKALKTVSKALGGRVQTELKNIHKAIPTGVLILDYLIGLKNADYKGYPKGRIIEVHGWESSGKTTLLTQACIEAQKLGMVPAFIDYEHVFDKTYAETQGLDTSEGKFYYFKPSYMEDCDPIMSELLSSGVIDFIVLDSIPSMVPKKTMEGDKETLALQARYVSQYIKKWNALASDNDCTLAVINQMRSNIGGMKDSKSTGGNALPFYASVRINLTPISKESKMIEDELTGEKDKQVSAIIVKATLVKNKVGIPHRSGEFRIILGEGVDNLHTLYTIAEKKGFLSINGAHYTYTSPKDAELIVKAHGKAALDNAFKESPALYEDLKSAVGL